MLLKVLPTATVFGADYRTPPETRGRVTACIDVRIAEKPAEQGVAEVTLVVSVEGPPGLKVSGVKIDEAVSGWKKTADPLPETRREGDSIVWTKTVALKQVKSGPYVPLPAIEVAFREGPDAPEETIEWPDLLRQPHVKLAPAELIEPPSTARWWRGLAVIALIVLNLLHLGGIVLLLRRRGELQQPLTPELRAIRELDAVAALMATDLVAAHERMADAVRGFFAERFPLVAAHNLGTAEFFGAVALPEEQSAALREFFERCDLVKFAGARPAPEECRHTVTLALAACGLAKPQAATPAAATPTPGR